MNSLFIALIETGCAVLLIFTLLGLLGRFHWVADLANHPRPFYLAAGVVLFGIALIAGQGWELYASIGIIAINGLLVVPYLIPKIQAETDQAHALTLMSANTLYGNYAPHTLLSTIKAIDPDILILQEMSATNQKHVAELWTTFPYVSDQPNRGSRELLVFSKLPFESIDYIAYDTPWRAQVHIEYIIQGQPLKVVGVHPKAPMSAGRFARRNAELGEIAADSAATQSPIIVAGDMNITPWTPVFHRFLRQAGLKDGRKRNGLNLTWAPHNAPLLIPIDQILYRGVHLHSFTSGPYTGSDHRPVIATFSLPEPLNSVAAGK